MKIIALEEHLITPEVDAAWAGLCDDKRDELLLSFQNEKTSSLLADLGENRLRMMDDSGVDVQVLSLTSPGVQNLAASEAVSLARLVNDRIAAAVAAHSGRFEGFATIPTPDPAAAVAELKRSTQELGFRGALINGRTGDRNLDHADFLPILAAAADLRVPVYIHPQMPQRGVRDAYYSGFDEKVSTAFAAPGIGWHYETGIQLVRLILAGVFDRLPDLQIILGHWGEVVLFYLDRLALLSRVATNLERPIPDYVRSHVHVTPGGILSEAYLLRSIEILGADRILHGVDYPYNLAPNGAARSFLESAPISQDDREKIAHRNWEQLTRR